MIRNIKASEGILVRSKTGINQVVPGQLEFPFCKMEMETWLTVRKTASAQHSRSCRDCLLPPHASWRRHSCTETYLRARQLTNTHPGTAIWVKMPEFNLQAFLTYMNPNLYIMTTHWITQSFLKKQYTHARATNIQTTCKFFGEPVWQLGEWALWWKQTASQEDLSEESAAVRRPLPPSLPCSNCNRRSKTRAAWVSVLYPLCVEANGDTQATLNDLL